MCKSLLSLECAANKPESISCLSLFFLLFHSIFDIILDFLLGWLVG